MNKKETKEQKYLIIDSTAIIHIMSKESFSEENTILVLPESIRDEIQSYQAETVFETLKTDNRIVFSTPTSESLKKTEAIAEKTGDIASLSKTDLQVIAIALDFSNSIVMSDDNAVQNVCFYLEIPIKPYSFKIRKPREYFWKCMVCGQRYNAKQDKCVECGSPTKRLFTKKKSL